ncbi:transcriptional repressor general negative regulator of transcription subunit 4, partial [Spiromyces aspiralis]
IAKIKAQKRAKEREKREIESDASKQLANVRVVQKNLVYVIGLPAHIATEEVLRSHDYFGQFGKINKIVINRRQHQGGQLSIAVYVTYARKEDATQAIEAVDGSTLDGRTLRATYGTTKYCSFYLRGITCQNPNCMYLHEPGEEADSYNKEDLASSRPHFHSQDGHGDHHRHHGGDGHNQHHRDSTSFPHIGNGRVQVVPAGTMNPHHHHPQQQRAASPAVGRNSAVTPSDGVMGIQTIGPDQKGTPEYRRDKRQGCSHAQVPAVIDATP